MGCAHLPDVGFAEEPIVVGPNKKGLWVQRDVYLSLGYLFYQLCDPAQWAKFTYSTIFSSTQTGRQPCGDTETGRHRVKMKAEIAVMYLLAKNAEDWRQGLKLGSGKEKILPQSLQKETNSANLILSFQTPD